MSQFQTLDWVEVIAWLASVLTVATYAMNTMMALRLLAIVSSILFIVYAVALQLWPLFAMEAVLLPINSYRLWQIWSLRGRLKRVAAEHGTDFSIIQKKAYPLHSGPTRC